MQRRLLVTNLNRVANLRGVYFVLTATLLVLSSSSSQVFAQPPTSFEFAAGDRIAVVGNGLADRMQHDGWLETFLQARLPEHKLSVRHLGFNGDELTIRMRSSGFGSPEDWLRRTEANVVFAFFGYNESFRDEAGVNDFKKNLTKFVNDTRAADDSGKPTRRVVLFSPIAYEDIGDPLLPAADELNRRLSLYADVMAEVAEQLRVPLVDLMRPSLERYRQSNEPLTINGIHLNTAGNRQVAQIIDQALFREEAAIDEAKLTRIRAAIGDKNFYWFQRYRTTDGYSIFGGRKNTGGSQWTPDNEKVMKREMEILDVMTANRDQRIWAVAQGRDLEVDDSNTPELIPVASNKPGPLGDGSYPFLGGEEAIEKMTLADGLEVNLFASEETFPELQNPVQAAIDTKGRLWAAVWPSYPHWRPKDEMNDKLLIFEDTDNDGRADKCKVFADGLHNPTGFEFYNGGVYVAQVPDVWFFKDTDGDDVADVRERVLGGIDSADTHHSVNSFVIGPGGGLYFQEGVFHRTQAETPFGPPVRVADAGVFRYDPKSQAFSAYSSYRFMNPHGHVFTKWGENIVHDGTSAVPFYGPAISGRTIYPQKHQRGPTVYDRRTRPCPATAILSSSHFPEQYRDTLLACNVIGVQGVLQYRIEDDGAGLKGTEIEPLILSTDPNFRPVDLEVGSDGSLYLLDWQNPLIGHLQHNLRDSNRDHRHGRIYRIRATDRELSAQPVVADQPVDALLEMLKHPDNGVRYRAKIELSRHDSIAVAEACKLWMKSLNVQEPQYEHHLLEALWVHQHHHVVNESLLRQLLASTDGRVRAAAAHVFRAWRKDISGAFDVIERLVRDEHPRVRLVGVLVCSDIDSPRAAEVALEAAKLPCDKFLEYTLLEATRTLAPQWRRALASGEPFCDDNPDALAYLLRSAKPADLLRFGSQLELMRALATLERVDPTARMKAITQMAKQRKTKPLKQLLELLVEKDAANHSVASPLAGLLEKFETKTLQGEESQLLELARGAKRSATREAAYASIVRIDGSTDRAWSLVSNRESGVLDFLGSVSRVPDKRLRNQFYKRVRQLMLNPRSLTPVEKENVLAKIESRAVDALAHLPGHDKQKISDLVKLVSENRSRENAVAVLQSISERRWNTANAALMVPATIEYLATVDAGDRASGPARKELDLAKRVAKLLPEDERQAALAKLESYGVQVLRLATIPHRMSYDQGKLVVQAGRPLQLVFENKDNMPHNLVLIQPGSLEKIGTKAEAEATLPETIARQYVPKTRQVLLATKLLQSQQSQTINFEAPTEPGVYPYVCTYPGHWRRMFGALYVVNDVAAYEADPEGYLAEHSIETKDTLLKYNRPLRNWTYDELSPSLDRLAEGRDFQRGSQLFVAASCAACHSVKDEQNRFAPDLTKLDAKRTPIDILRSVVEPSKEIDKQYKMSKLLLDSGKVMVGLVVEETADEVTLMVDPLASCEPTFIKKEEIEDRFESELSLMPAGLLDRFTEEEILELCAYVVARGDENADVYQSPEGN